MIRAIGRVLLDLKWSWDGWQIKAPSKRVEGCNTHMLLWWVGWVDSPDGIRAWTITIGPLAVKASWLTLPKER